MTDSPPASASGAPRAVSLTATLGGLTEYWSQVVVGEANGTLLKVAKGIGSTRWHSHDDQDETFVVLEGRLTIQLRDGDVELGPGDLYVIPQGVEHCPRADDEVRFLILGTSITSNAAVANPTGASPADFPRGPTDPSRSRGHG